MVEKIKANITSASDALRLHNLIVLSDVEASDENAKKSREATRKAVESAQDLIAAGGLSNYQAAERIVTKAANSSHLPRRVIAKRVKGK